MDDNMYKYFFYNNLDICCISLSDGTIIDINNKFVNIMGYSKNDLIILLNFVIISQINIIINLYCHIVSFVC